MTKCFVSAPKSGVVEETPVGVGSGYSREPRQH